jgi:hypothetical protein
MKNILCLEVLERRAGTDEIVVKDRFPLDRLPGDLVSSVSTVSDLEPYIDSLIEAPIDRLCVRCRLWYILDNHFPNHFYRFSRMNWKWDEEYYKNLKPSHGKGMRPGEKEDE